MENEKLIIEMLQNLTTNMDDFKTEIKQELSDFKTEIKQEMSEFNDFPKEVSHPQGM